jgi:purine-binding chemotaxis protein CheW
MNIAELRKKSLNRPAVQVTVEQVPVSAPPTPPAKTPEVERLPLVAAAAEAILPPPQPGAAETIVTTPPQRTRLDELFSVQAQHDTDLEARSLAGAWSQEKQTVEEFRQMLSFSLGNEEYALDIHDIREIIKPRDITDIPRVPEFVLGIISLRGIVIPVFDLKRRFKLGTSLLSPSSRIIVCQRGNKSAGLLVDSISQVIKVPYASIEPPPPILSGLERELLDGIGRHRERMLILLNMPCVLNTDLI